MTNKEAIKVIDDMLVNYRATYSLLNVDSEAADEYIKHINALNIAKDTLDNISCMQYSNECLDPCSTKGCKGLMKMTYDGTAYEYSCSVCGYVTRKKTPMDCVKSSFARLLFSCGKNEEGEALSSDVET